MFKEKEVGTTTRPAKQHVSKNKLKTRLGHFWHRRRWYIVGGAALLFALLFWVMQANAAAPGQIGYPIKRAFEEASLLATIGSDAKNRAQTDNAGQRVQEATVVADRIANESPKQQVADTQTIQDLLTEYIKIYSDNAAALTQRINDTAKNKDASKEFENDSAQTVRVYENLVKLRLLSPPEAQATVLQATSVAQSTIAIFQDALHASPISPQDSDQFAKLVSQGFLTRAELTQLLSGVTSNRQLLDTLRSMVANGQLPSSILYAINYDLIKKYDAKNEARFVASIDFDEMRKVAIFSKVVLPTPEQKQTIQAYMADYTPGKQLPRDASRAYIMPLVYGLNLTPELSNDLKNLDPNGLSPVRRTLYEAWKPLTTAKQAADPKQLYSEVLQLTDTTVARNVELMERVQLEVLRAVRANVAYLALPPGWTATQVAMVQNDFAQQIKDLKLLTTTQAKAQTALSIVADMSTPLVAPLSDPQVDAVRQIAEKQMIQMQQQMVTTANATTTPDAAAPDLNKQIAAVQQQFDAQISALGQLNGAAAQEASALRAEVKTALQSAADAQSKLQDYVKSNSDLQASLAASLAAAQAAQNGASATLQNSIAQLDATTQTALASSVQAIKTTISQNVSSLQDQLNSVSAASQNAQTSLALNLLAQSNQIAGLQDKLNLSDTARAVLKAQADQAIAKLQADQSKLIDNLQKQIDSNAALHAQLNDATKKEINDIKNQQSQLLNALKDEAGDKQLLKDQLLASIATLHAAQSQTADKVQTVAASGESLAKQLQSIKGDLDTATRDIRTHIAETALARAELQKSIDGLKADQTTTRYQIENGLQALSVQLHQAVSEVAAAQAQTAVDLAGLRGGVDSVKDSVANLQTLQVDIHLRLQAQEQASLALRHDLDQSVSQLQKAQATTQTQVDTLSTNVGQLKTSVAAIADAQTTAQAQINGILTTSLNWSKLPDTLQFSQEQFRQYEKQLADEFAAKAAALQQQFDAYKQQLDGTIQQLQTDTNNQLQALKDQQAQLQTQLKAAQDQLKQLQAVPTATPTTPTTTTTPSTIPTTTTPTSTPPVTTPSTTVPSL